LNAAGFFHETEGGVAVSVRVTPRSGRDAIEGIQETADGRAHLKVRLRAVPEDGKANAALERLVAAALGLPARDVAVAAGKTSRIKTVMISGDRAAIATALRALAGSSEGAPDQRR
jgi:uncharacterized protein